ncbi:MAG: dTDP-4-dehydrorhamnose 3,5-epimerase [Bacteroides sp.]|nr:dTDP-4-dehydrorhamnose 3,5-epimerase [Bacteroides sp.]MCM1378992.1 dTDP-4-dehydrorhamnose 3,5-epimerase [Bacteroides sp.]MCM1445608.1 dTDP-4-dehydrorhamnose 3,5-epimerase [Prevotella sp.]
MEVIKTSIPGLVIIEPQVFTDSRGYFFESFNARKFAEKVAQVTFVQDNESCSQRGVIRGLHFQRGNHAQAKLIRVVSGAVLDVAVDLRPDSPTYGQHEAIELTAENRRQLFIPRGFAHGFAVLSDSAVFQYKCDNFYAPQSEGGIDPFDPTLAIEWPFSRSEAILSEKDKLHPSFK